MMSFIIEQEKQDGPFIVVEGKAYSFFQLYSDESLQRTCIDDLKQMKVNGKSSEVRKMAEDFIDYRPKMIGIFPESPLLKEWYQLKSKTSN